MTPKKTLLLGIAIITTLWCLSWLLMVCFLPDQATRGQFGDMFGTINSLFSGLALCGVVYSILLQQESNRISRYQFRFNHILDIVNKQTDIFNERIMDFYFVNNDGNLLKFSEGIRLYKSIENNSRATSVFLARNKETINSILPFIYHSNKFTHDTINEQDIKDSDKDKLKILYFRNQNRLVIDYFSLIREIIKAEKEEYESIASDLKEIHNKIMELKFSMLKSILESDYT